MLVIERIVQQHAEEAAFLRLLRNEAVHRPDYLLDEVVKLDHRIEAHLDGLRIAGDAGWKICKQQLEDSGVGEVFTAGMLAFERGDESRINQVLAVVEETAELASALASALGWLGGKSAQLHINRLLVSRSSVHRQVGISGSTILRQDPGQALQEALTDQQVSLRSRSLRAIGELGRKDLLLHVRNALKAEDDEVRSSAAWSASLLAGDKTAIDSLLAITESSSLRGQKALQMAVRRMDLPAARAWQNKLAQDAKQFRTAIAAGGAIGDPVIVPWLIEQLKVPELARVAGEAFTMITGLDITSQNLEARKPDGFETGPTENPEDENVEMDPDENLPWPNPALIAKWWSAHQGEFQKGTRYLLGKPITIDWMQQVLRIGKQRQRAAAALELAIRQPGTPLFNVSAPGFHQQQLLGLQR